MAAGDYAGDAFFFLSYEGEIIVRNCLHGKELLERHEASRNHLSFWIFVSLLYLLFPILVFNYFNIKIQIQHFYFDFLYFIIGIHQV